ncbi:hypothetical protein [Streptosporangium roseum]|nr:hypothetical protein [Streptosporangium roseum]
MLSGEEHVERHRATDGAEGHGWQGIDARDPGGRAGARLLVIRA